MMKLNKKTLDKIVNFNNNRPFQIPEELVQRNKNLELSIDTIYVNGMLFLKSISHELYYRTAQFLPSKKKNNYINCMKEIINICRFEEFST